jgi:hypothetical protein
MSETVTGGESTKPSDSNTLQSRETTDVSPSSIAVERLSDVQIRETWVGWTQVAANILVPITLLVAVASLFIQTWQTKIDNSNLKIESFYGEGLVAAQTTLFSLWLDEDMSPLDEPQTRHYIDALVDITIERSTVPKRDTVAALVSITTYFDRVEACLVANRCDEKTILNQIGQYGRDFYCLYQGQVDILRNQTRASAQFGSGLAAFAARNGGCM